MFCQPNGFLNTITCSYSLTYSTSWVYCGVCYFYCSIAVPLFLQNIEYSLSTISVDKNICFVYRTSTYSSWLNIFNFRWNISLSSTWCHCIGTPERGYDVWDLLRTKTRLYFLVRPRDVQCMLQSITGVSLVPATDWADYQNIHMNFIGDFFNV